MTEQYSAVERLRRAHGQPRSNQQPYVCRTDGQLWPCDAALTISVLEAARTGLEVAAGERALRAEATAAAEQRLRAGIEALAVLAKGYRPVGMHDGLEAARLSTLADAIDELAALLDTPPPASPRQGEPVDVERLRKALVATVRIDAYRDGPAAMRVTEPDDWQRIAEVIAAEYADLSEPAEAGEPG